MMPWPTFFLILMNPRHRADVCGAAVQRDRDKKGCGGDRVWGQAQHVGDLQRGIIDVWNWYEFLFILWWLHWIFNAMKRWQVIFLSPPLLERRNHRWRFASIRKKDFTVSGVPSKFHGLPQKIHYSISLFQPTARKRCSWTTMMKSTHAWKRGR